MLGKAIMDPMAPTVAMPPRTVWDKAGVIPGIDHRVRRRDRYGFYIDWAEYGKRTVFGWVIDHVVPVSRGGSDDLGNLQPLHWENNQAKDEGRLLRGLPRIRRRW